MMMRKGQVTVFIIIGMLLTVLVALSLAFKDSIMEQASKIELTKGLAMSKEARRVQSEMQGCVKDLTDLGLIVIGLQGGYSVIDARVQHTETGTVYNYVPYLGTAYVYYKGQNLVPTKELMEKQLAFFVTEALPACEPEYKDIKVSYGKPMITSTILDEKIRIDVDMDVKVKKGEVDSGFKTITFELPVRLGTIQNVAGQIIDKQIKVSEEEICVSCIARIAAENDMEVTITKVGDDIFYSLTDKNSKVAGYDYNFMMANKF